MKTHEKQIGVLIGKLACNDIHLAEACKLIQEQLDLLKIKAWKQGMTDAAEMVRNDNWIGHNLATVYEHIITDAQTKDHL